MSRLGKVYPKSSRDFPGVSYLGHVVLFFLFGDGGKGGGGRGGLVLVVNRGGGI